MLEQIPFGPVGTDCAKQVDHNKPLVESRGFYEQYEHWEPAENNMSVIGFALCGLSGFVVGFIVCGLIRWIF